MSAPRLLRGGNGKLPRMLFSDLQLDKILSEEAISVLQKPCGADDIRRRAELFILLESESGKERFDRIFRVLSSCERALLLLDEAQNDYERYHRHACALEAYADALNALSSMTDFGSLFADAAAYFGTSDKTAAAAEMKKSAGKIRALLFPMHSELLSLSGKSWLTPDAGSVSETDCVANCAKKLGFAVSSKRSTDVKVNRVLSEAICALYSDECAQIEDEIAKYADVDMSEPTKYLAELSFFREITELCVKAAETGVPHCRAKLSDEVIYRADKLYDVSLLAKKCEHIVPNDAYFGGGERFCFLTGANGGGKTTYLRAVGINLVLFLSGCPCFADNAEIYPFALVLSHFQQDERFDDTGRLDEEKGRADEMLCKAEKNTSFLLFNETFSGTDEKRGFELLKETVEKIHEYGCFGLYVTHFHEVKSLGEPVLSAEINADDGNRRTFRIVRAKGSASSYAADILRKYRLDKDSLNERRRANGDKPSSSDR